LDLGSNTKKYVARRFDCPRPDALAAAADRTVDHAAAGEGTVAEHIRSSTGLLTRGGVLEARAECRRRIEVARFAGHAVAGVVVEAAHSMVPAAALPSMTSFMIAAVFWKSSSPDIPPS